MSPSGEHSRPWSSVLPLSAPTPHFRRPTETPIGKIQPVFDDFALVDTSWGSDSSFSASTPRFKVPHKTPETKRRRREELYTPAPAQADYSPVPALHEDDLCARRLADLGRRTPLAPLPSEKFQEVAPVPMPDSVTAPPVNKPKAPSRVERARAAGIPVLTTRSSARPRMLPPLRRPEPPQPRHDPPKVREAPSLAASASHHAPPRYTSVIPEEPAPPVARSSLSSASSQSTPSQPRATSPKPHQHVSRPSHESLRLSKFQPYPHTATPLAVSSTGTPASIASLAPSASTLDGRSELWDLSMATPTTGSSSRVPPAGSPAHPPPTSSKRDRRKSLFIPAEAGSSVRSARSPPGDDRHCPTPPPEDILPTLSFSLNTNALQDQPQRRAPPAGAQSPAVDDSKESGGILGFLAGIFLNPPAPPPSAPKSASPVRSFLKSSRPGPVRNKTSHRPGGHEDRPIRAAPKTRRITNGRTGSKPPPSNNVLGPRPLSHRQPLAETHGATVNHAHVAHQKRKEPPSPIKHHHPISTGRTRGSAPPSYTRPTTASLSATQPDAKLRNSMRPLSQSTAPRPPRPRPVSRVTPFVAQALARMPKPGEGATSASKPVSIADHERARELAIRKAVFERAGKAELPAPLPEAHATAHRSALPPTHSARIPGEATRRRAEAQAANRERRNRKAAEEARIAAEEARIRSEIEAELDRQARQATVFRPNPLPEMYHRH